MDTSIVVSIFAICISGLTAWFTLFHKGVIKMTQPNIVAIIPKEGRYVTCPKIFIRVLLYCTSKSGRAVESMFIKISHGQSVKKFQYWAYGNHKQLVPGSGMFVGPNGYEANHHFTPLENNAAYDFRPGLYTIDVYGKTVGDRKPILMKTISISLSNEASDALKSAEDTAVFFWWDAETETYISKIDKKPNIND